MDYTSREVLRLLKQYDMFLNSLNLTDDASKKERICDQLDRIEKQILLETNNEYEEEYMILLGEETSFFADEKTRLRNLIGLVNSRRNYLEERKANHKKITGSLVELTTFLGEDKLSIFKNRLRIIEKYEENKARQQSLVNELKVLDVKISEASRTVKANARLNDILESKMMALIGKAIDKLNLYSLVDRRKQIESKHETLDYAFEMAKENLKNAKLLNNNDMVIECDNMLSEITLEYSKYNEEVNILKLMDMYDKPATGYEEILAKREEINEILKNITESDLYKEIAGELNKAYNTIKLEKKDVETYEVLKEDREKKNNKLYEMDEENNSKEFKDVLDEFIKNENKVQEEKIKLAKMQEYEERQKKLLEEQKIEAARVKRQKLIEEARLKEQMERAEKVKELQEKTILNRKVEPAKAFDDKISSSFNANELFDKTKIVPNKVQDKVEEDISYSTVDDNSNHITGTSLVENISYPKEENKEVDTLSDSIDLFKEEGNKINDLEIKEDKKESIYDKLNGNDFWKENDSSSIPIIGNNNLKPEIINSSNDDIAFPTLDVKEGDLLWKETL